MYETNVVDGITMLDNLVRYLRAALPLLREELVEMLRKLWPELEVVAQTGDGIDALRLLTQHQPTVMFLDIQMPRHRDAIDELDPNLYWQIHRSTLVNVNAVAGVTRDLRAIVTWPVADAPMQAIEAATAAPA